MVRQVARCRRDGRRRRSCRRQLAISMPLTIAGETYIGTLLWCRLRGTSHAIQLDDWACGAYWEVK